MTKQGQQELCDWSLLDGKFVKLETDAEKVLVLGNPKIEKKVFKEGEEPKLELSFEVVEEDGRKWDKDEKVFSTTSRRLQQKLKPIFEGEERAVAKKLSITRVGEGFDTRYIVKEL